MKITIEIYGTDEEMTGFVKELKNPATEWLDIKDYLPDIKESLKNK